MNEVLIDLNRIYENQPNTNWTPDSWVSLSKDSMSLHQNLAADLTAKIWKAVHFNQRSIQDGWNKGWTNMNFFISGERGSGKSTFLQYVTWCITQKVNPFIKAEAKQSVNAPRIEMLFFCDPTAMSSNENFFVSIIAALKDWIRQESKKDKWNDEHHLGYEMCPPQKEKIFNDQIKSLACGIHQLYGKGSSAEEELDPVSQLRMGMNNSTSALQLKNQFNKLINDMAASYKVQAFLIAIDDADIEFTKNKLIIEIIRTYLTHPRLIILFTGDTILTHEAIREKQFNQFDLPFHKADIVNQKRRWELTDAMTAQYIKKIFPPSNHLHLPSLHDTIKKHANYVYRIAYDFNGNTRKEELIPFLIRLFSNTLEENPARVILLIEGFLRLPLRSIMHTLRYWGDRQLFNQLQQLEREAAEVQKMLSEATLTPELLNARQQLVEHKREISRLMADSFRSAFNDELLSQGFSKAELEMDNTYRLARGLLLHCFNSKDISYGHRLVISACRYDNQESTFFLAAKESCIVKDFGDALAFVLFGVFTIHAYRYYQQTCMDKEVQPNIASYDLTKVEQYLRHKQQEFVNYLFASNNEDPLRWTRKLSLIFLSHSGQNLEKDALPRPWPLFLSRGVCYLSGKNDIALLNQTFRNQVEIITSRKRSEGKN